MPSQTMDYIGARINSVNARIFLPTEHIQKIVKAMKHSSVSAHHSQHLLGLMASTTSALSHAQLKMRSLQAWFLAQFDPMLDSQNMCLRVTPELAK